MYNRELKLRYMTAKRTILKRSYLRHVVVVVAVVSFGRWSCDFVVSRSRDHCCIVAEPQVVSGSTAKRRACSTRTGFQDHYSPSTTLDHCPNSARCPQFTAAGDRGHQPAPRRVHHGYQTVSGKQLWLVWRRLLHSGGRRRSCCQGIPAMCAAGGLCQRYH